MRHVSSLRSANRCFTQHLARHRLADLFLDTLPYNAHTTASDALWAGLPVLTCYGTSFQGRVATSLLNAIGLPELVTADLEEYESLALRLATQPSLLTDFKARLERNRRDVFALRCRSVSPPHRNCLHDNVGIFGSKAGARTASASSQTRCACHVFAAFPRPPTLCSRY